MGRRKNSTSGFVIATLFILGLIVSAVKKGVTFLQENPVVLLTLGGLAMAAIAGYAFVSSSRRKRASTFFDELREVYSIYDSAIDSDSISKILSDKASLLVACPSLQDEIERTASSLLSEYIGMCISRREFGDVASQNIGQLGRLVGGGEADRVKASFFKRFFAGVSSSNYVSDESAKDVLRVSSLLGLSSNDIARELKILRDMLDAQNLVQLPSSIPAESVSLQRDEELYFSSEATVYIKKKTRSSSDYEEDYELQAKRTGPFYITNKRLLIVKQGTTQVKLSDILDIEADVRRSMLVITRDSVERPTYIQTPRVIYASKLVCLLKEATES